MDVSTRSILDPLARLAYVSSILSYHGNQRPVPSSPVTRHPYTPSHFHTPLPRHTHPRHTPHATTIEALHVAAANGRLEVARWLVDQHNALVDLVDADHETALFKAAHHGHPEVVRFLLERHANPNHRTRTDGWTGGCHHTLPPLPCCHLITLPRVTLRFFTLATYRCFPPTPLQIALHGAASRGHLDVVRVLVDWPATQRNAISHEQQHGRTALGMLHGWVWDERARVACGLRVACGVPVGGV